MADPGTADLSGDRRRRTALIALPFVVLTLLAAATIVVALAEHDASSRAEDRTAALVAAETMAHDLTSIDYRTARPQLQRIVSHSTGAFRRLAALQLQKFPDVLRQERSVSRGTVLAAGLSSYGGDHARAAAAVDAVVTSRAAAQRGPGSQHYRMVLDLARVHGQWLVSQVNFLNVVGPPT